MSQSLPSIMQAKQEAKRLRGQLASQGTEISHTNALELIAKQYGFRDWNTFHAAIGDRPPENWKPGGRVRGTYMAQPFEATVMTVTMVTSGWYRLMLNLDEAVDVVTFDSFSNFRKRVQGTVGPAGETRERTSNGVPHLKLDI